MKLFYYLSYCSDAVVTTCCAGSCAMPRGVMASSEVCMEKIRMAMNKVMEKGIVPKWWKITKTVMIPKTK